jgi:hypothetical protein
MTHPITPPPELVQQWWEEADQYQRSGDNAKTYFDYVAAKSAQWGADQELEACCDWLMYEHDRQGLRAARRSKPPSLKAQALDVLDKFSSGELVAADKMVSTIRRALEALPDGTAEQSQ